MQIYQYALTGGFIIKSQILKILGNLENQWLSHEFLIILFLPKNAVSRTEQVLQMICTGICFFGSNLGQHGNNWEVSSIENVSFFSQIFIILLMMSPKSKKCILLPPDINRQLYYLHEYLSEWLLSIYSCRNSTWYHRQ